VIQVRDFAIFISQNGELYLGVLGAIDVFDPSLVRLGIVYRHGNHLGFALGELARHNRGVDQFGRANRGEIGRMGKQNAPAVTQELVELDLTNRGILFEIRGGIAQTQCRHGSSLYDETTDKMSMSYIVAA